MKKWFAQMTAMAIVFAGLVGGVAPAQAADAPDVYVQKLVNEAAAGNGKALWNALPEDYQGDVEDLLEEFTKNMDAELWDGGFKLVGKLAKVLKDKKEFVVGSQFTQGIPGPQKDAVTKEWDSIVEALSMISKSDISTHEGLKELDIEEFFDKTGSKLADGLLKASENAPQVAEGLKKLKSVKVTLVSKDGDEAVLKFQADGEEPKEETYTLDGGKWLPKKMVDDWDGDIAKAKAQLAAVKLPAEKKTQVIAVMGGVDKVFDQLLAAKDQQAFDGALLGLIGMFAGPPGGAPADPK